MGRMGPVSSWCQVGSSIMSSHFCCYCGVVHPSSRWYTLYNWTDPHCVRWCNAVYLRLLRFGAARHPLWLHLQPRLARVDNTGRSIALLIRRADISALLSADAILRGSLSWHSLELRVFALALLFQAYWPEPVLMLTTHLLSMRPSETTPERLRSYWRLVDRALRRCRYVDGSLRISDGGLQPMKNPSERRNGRVRYNALTRSLDLWRIVSRRVAQRLGTAGGVVAIRTILNAFDEPGFRVFNSSICYRNVRLVRAIVVGLGYSIADTPDDWSILSGMSPSMRRMSRRWGLGHDAAICLRDSIRRQHSSYSLLDLSCFLCLADF